jgi:mycoredoxin
MTEAPQLTVYGNSWCGGARRARLFLDRHKIPYQWVDIDGDPAAGVIVEQITGGFRSVPTFVWADGTSLVEPSETALAQKLGINLA